MLQLHKDDNVAVAVEDCSSKTLVHVKAPEGVHDFDIEVQSEIPFGHKCALTGISLGNLIIKYGKPIGRATTNIQKGELVGVHNIEGLCGRGDQKNKKGG